MIKTGAAMFGLIAGLGMVTEARAQTVLEFRSANGWYEGARAGAQCGEGVCVSLEIRRADQGQIYAVAHYRANDYWCGGSRVTRNYPSNAFFTTRSSAGRPSSWGEYMPSGITTIFVYLRQERC